MVISEFLPATWRRYLRLVRVLLGLLFLAGLLFSSSLSIIAVTLFGALFLAYGAVLLFWRSFEQLAPPLLALVLDTIFFLLCVTYSFRGSPANLWVSAAFFFYLMLTSALLHTWREVLMVAAVCFAFIYAVGPQEGRVLWPMVLMTGIFATILTFYYRSLTERLTGASEQAILSRAEAEQAREAERQRIAADFHDGPLQSFISFQMRLEVLRRMLSRDIATGLEELGQLQEVCKAQVAELRAFVKSMRPVQYGDTMGAAFRRLADDFQKDSRIGVSLSMPDAVARREVGELKELLSLVREALHNVQKHSRATRVSVALDRCPEGLQVEVMDDGEGFAFAGTFTLAELEQLRMGPMSIQRRIRSLKGELTVESRPGRGSTLRVQVPA